MNKNLLLLTLASAHFTCNALDVSNPEDRRVIVHETVTIITPAPMEDLGHAPAFYKSLRQRRIENSGLPRWIARIIY